jgi:DnaK suppressor protein
MISAEQTEALRGRLDRRLAELERSLEATADALEPVKLDQTSVGRLSRMDALQQQALRAGLREGLIRERRRAEAALVRVAEGRYGICCACEMKLPLARLHADPAAPFCISCETGMRDTKRNR